MSKKYCSNKRPPRIRTYGTPEQRLNARFKVDPKTGCWVWQNRVNAVGYGCLVIGGTFWLAHRLSYTLFVGDIPKGKEIDHLCRNRACCNPKHLEPITRRENLARSPIIIWEKRAALTHCKRGHLFSVENTRWYNGRERVCRACENIRCEKYKRKKARAS